MPRWFLSTRAHSVGGPVAPVKVIDADRMGQQDLLPELQDAIRGHEVFFGVHGFNVNQQDGIDHLSFWFEKLEIGNAIPIGILWPGDCFIPIFVDYVVEGHEAIYSGRELAAYLKENFTDAVSLCFASHSLGARVVLETIQDLGGAFSIRRTVLMAGAIDNNALSEEYSGATKSMESISILASRRDWVLEGAFPLGNPIQGIIDSGHPYHHAAIGREGPADPASLAPKLQPGWQIPDYLDYGHLDYIPGAYLPQPFPPPVNIPPDPGPNPPAGTPPVYPKGTWKPAFSAGFVSERYK